MFARYGLGKSLANYAKFLWRDVVFHRAVPLDAQLRVENERDVGNAVSVDLKSGVVKVRRLQETLIIHLKRQSAEWIRRRVEEGAKLKTCLPRY